MCEPGAVVHEVRDSDHVFCQERLFGTPFQNSIREKGTKGYCELKVPDYGVRYNH